MTPWPIQSIGIPDSETEVKRAGILKSNHESVAVSYNVPDSSSRHQSSDSSGGKTDPRIGDEPRNGDKPTSSPTEYFLKTSLIGEKSQEFIPSTVTSRRNSANFTRRRSSTPKFFDSDFLRNITYNENLDPEKLHGIAEDNQSQPENLDLTVPTKLWPQVFAALAVSLADMMIGLSTAYSSPAISSMSEVKSTLRIEVAGEEASWIGSLMPLGALVGGLIGGTMSEIVGRKRTILAIAPPFVLSWLLICFATNIWTIYIARAIAGLCVGVTCLSLPLYLAETVQPEVRGTLGLMPTTLGNTGILIAYFAGAYLNWRNLALLGAILCTPFIICMMFIPETPRWYITKGREVEGEESLQWFRGAGADIKTELAQIKNANMMSKKYATKLKTLFGRAYVKPLVVSLGLMFFQQFSGINAVIFYTKTIFKMTGSNIDENLCSIIIGGVNIVATICATVLIDRVGRKVLLLISDIFMIITLLTLGIFFYLKENHEDSVFGLGWIPLISFMVFVAAFSLGFGPVPWLMMGEIFPARIRGYAAAVTTAFNWACTFTVTKCFPEVVGLFGPSTAFFAFAVVCLIGILFIVFYVPETRGESLEQIEANLTRPFRRVSSFANLKPFPTTV